MGQAWCKERSAKAHDSKSPLDRVFVRCAHTIYPGLKEEGSVLGATQRVTSSEIGYAGSPPRSALLRGHSIDSVDRPFHPSEWVDVNLEVPCEPRSSVILAARSQHRWSSYSPDSYDVSSRSLPAESTTPVPVPPPRRRRRRDKRLPPPPAKSDATENSSEADNRYSQAVSSNDELDLTIDSDDEFERIEQSLQKDSLEEIPLSESTRLEESTSAESPKNHTASSLPNVDELRVNSPSFDRKSTTHEEDDEDEKRSPRHAKTASLTHDATLDTSQVVDPEGRGSLSAAGVEDSAGANSIAADCSLSFDVHVETSTPVKRPSAEAAVDGPDHPEQPAAAPEASLGDSADSSSAAQEVAGLVQDVDRPADQVPAGNEDAGYESRDSASRLFFEASRNETFHDATDELSSGIIEDAVTRPGDSMRFEQLALEGDSLAIQRTISEESLPREMLVDELDEDNDGQLNEEKSAKDASNQLTRQTSANDSENSKTPPPSPEPGIEPSAPAGASEALRNGLAEKADGESAKDKPALPSSLTELEAALSEMLDKKDEHERELDKTRLEPRIVPQLMKLGRDPEGELELAKPAEKNARVVDLYRPERLNPFNESVKNEQNSLMDEAPEKPSRLHRISLIEESIISEPLIVPTPPRRKHRSKSNLSNLNSSDEMLEALHTYATHDRLI